MNITSNYAIWVGVAIIAVSIIFAVIAVAVLTARSRATPSLTTGNGGGHTHVLTRVEDVLYIGLPIGSVFVFFVVWLTSSLTTGALAGLLVFVVWVTGFHTIDTKERAVKVFFGNPYTTAESGLRWVIPIGGTLDKRSTEIIELEFSHEAGIVTKKGRAVDKCGVEIQGGREYGSVTIGATVSLLFQYPRGDALIRAVKLLPNKKEELADLFEEAVLDEVRTVGGDYPYPFLIQRRAHFAQKVLEAIRIGDGVLSKLLKESGLDNIQVAIKHLNIPGEVTDAINAEEKAELNSVATIINATASAKATVITGKGDSDAIRLKGGANAQAKDDMLKVLRKHPENKDFQALLTLIEMAQGPATTIFPLSTDLTNVLGKVLRGNPSDDDELMKLFGLLPAGDREKLINTLRDELRPKGGAA